MAIRILGIDPGSTITGYAIIDFVGRKTQYVDSGCIKLSKEPMPTRLMMIHQGIQELIVSYKPREFAIEQIFMHANPNSALKLGQARGVALAVAALHGLPIGEYAPKAIKNAVVGTGGASKEQVQYMVKVILGLEGKIQSDAADALAISLTHAHHLQTNLAHKKSGRNDILG